MTTTPTNKDSGLQFRYHVTKANGDTNPNAKYFVLRLDNECKDPEHLRACRAAVLKYADEIEHHLPQLAEDIRTYYFQPTTLED